MAPYHAFKKQLLYKIKRLIRNNSVKLRPSQFGLHDFYLMLQNGRLAKIVYRYLQKRESTLSD